MLTFVIAVAAGMSSAGVSLAFVALQKLGHQSKSVNTHANRRSKQRHISDNTVHVGLVACVAMRNSLVKAKERAYRYNGMCPVNIGTFRETHSSKRFLDLFGLASQNIGVKQLSN